MKMELKYVLAEGVCLLGWVVDHYCVMYDDWY